MNADHSLSELDRDGALQEAAARVSGHSRATVLAKAVVGTGALVALLAEPAEAALAADDVDVLNYALTLEFLQADFYTEAERAAALTGQTARAARVVGAVERA
ncbi:MAG: ferritin-like domain-containing protein, partial [Burkholderiales bacterium]